MHVAQCLLVVMLILPETYSCMAGNEDKILSAKKWLTRFWGGVWRASEYLSTTHAPPLTHTFIALTLVCVVDVRDNTESGDQVTATRQRRNQTCQRLR